LISILIINIPITLNLHENAEFRSKPVNRFFVRGDDEGRRREEALPFSTKR